MYIHKAIHTDVHQNILFYLIILIDTMATVISYLYISFGLFIRNKPIINRKLM